MGTDIDKAPLVEHRDPVGEGERGAAVGDQQRRTARHDLAQRLVDLSLDAGVDGFNPCEVAAGMDPVYLRKKYGKSMNLIGGIDKRELAKGKVEIDREVRKILPLLEEGGYFPTVDHTVPPDIPLDNFKYYMEVKTKALLGEL